MKTMETMIPELRFEGFEGEWEEKELKKITSFIKDGTHASFKDSLDTKYKLLSAKNINNGKIRFDSMDRTISEADYKDIYKNYFLKEGDVLLTIVGTIGRLAIFENEKNIAFQRSVAFLRFNKVFNYFAYQLLNSYKCQKEFLTKQVVSAQPGLYLGDLSKIVISFPTLPEQTKIASFLSSVDIKIEQTTQQIELLKEYKKGLMQQLFPQKDKTNPRLRFTDDEGKDFPDWEKKKLKDVGKVITGSTPLTSNPEYYNGNYSFVSPADIGNKKYISTTIKTLTKEGFSKTRNIAQGSILFVCIGSIGKIGISGVALSTNQQINSIVVCNNSAEYVYYQLLRESERIKLLASIQVLPIINKTSFEVIKINIPSLPEQTKIANLLSSLDNKIEQTEQQLEQMQVWKKGLLQKMFV